MKMYLIAALLLLYFNDAVNAQTVIGRQKVDQYPITSKGAATYGLTWLPTDYASTSQSYPLIIFLHAAGEVGDGVAGLNNLIKVGLPKKIADGWNPQAVNPSDKKNYQFIVVSPQASTSSGWSYSYAQVVYILADVEKRYRVDATRVYIVGESAGGGGTWSCVTNDSNFTKKIAAIIPISPTGVNDPTREYGNIQYISGKYGVKVWTICGTKDLFYNVVSLPYVNIINTATPAPSVPAVATGVAGYGHDTTLWNKVTDVSWRSNNFKLNLYEWMLQYQRGSLAPAANKAPVANAGTDKTITLPENKTTLSGSGTDADGTITAYLWTKVGGPSQFTITSPTLAQTTVTNLIAGTYRFELKVTDNAGATAKDTASIIVLPKPNIPPVVNAGSDQTLKLPVNSTTVTGTATDADGTITAHNWKKVAGPGSPVIQQPSALQTAITGLIQGDYKFEFSATDNNGATTKDTVVIKVQPQNVAPVANAGRDTTLILPANSVTLKGSGTDADGTISSYKWTKISGPSQYVIGNSKAATTTVTGLTAGTYIFRLTVTDNNSSTATDDVTIIVETALTGYITIPGKIEAENYSAMSGVKKEPTNDTGGGQDVGWIDKDDWMDYRVYVDSSGVYTASFRIATALNNGKLQLRKSDGTVLATVDIPNTASYQGWCTRSVTVNLSQGYQTIRIVSTEAVNWNINWMSFTRGVSAGIPIPSKVQAEDYSQMSGIQMEPTGDTGGGLNVGWINKNDWMDYTVYAAAGGTYTVNLRLATSNYSARLEIRKQDGTVLNSVNIPGTGGYQKWVTVSTSINIPSGKQTLRIVSTSTQDWNINWIEFVRPDAAIAQTLNISLQDSITSFRVFPNPVTDKLSIEINNDNKGTIHVQVCSMGGSIVKEFKLIKNVQGKQNFDLKTDDLAKGLYIMRLQYEDKVDSKIIVKQ